MATVDSVSKDVSALGERIASLEAQVKLWGTFLGAIGVLAVGAGGTALGWCVHLSTKVAVIESGGNTKLVTELKYPSSPQQLEANLNTVVGQLQTVRVTTQRVDPSKMESLSSALADVIQRDPSISDGWRAASAAINLRPATSRAGSIPVAIEQIESPRPNSSDDCYKRPVHYTITENANGSHPARRLRRDEPVILNDCTIRLDDLKGFTDSVELQLARMSSPTRRLRLVLLRVKIVYNGGAIIPVDRLQAYACTYDFNVPTTPPVAGRQLFTALLSQSFSETEVSVQFTS